MRRTRHWTSTDAEALYNTAHWGEGYFGVNSTGHLAVRPRRDAAEIDLFALTQSLQQQGVRLPLLVRFTDILEDRVKALAGSFDAAIAQAGYSGRYTPVYPIKVNQQRSVVEHILAGGRVGLEAGSKPELMAVLGLAPKGATIVCNGYKDRGFIRLALIGLKLGHRVYIVVEKLSELDLVIAEARALKVEPLLGIRVRLATIGAGKWQNTGGEKSKFGLSAAQVLEAVEKLRAAEQLGALRMVHCHLGSQIANLRDIRGGMREVARFYAELRKLGAPLDCVDVGGGLGVDYEGTRSRSYCSMNYAMQDYATGVVETLAQVCAAQQLPQPDIISESGRAMTAHHAVLVVNVVDSETTPGTEPQAPARKAPPVLQELWQILKNHNGQPELERLQDAAQAQAEAQALYAQGELSLAERAQAEQMYFAICRRIQPKLDPQARAHREALDSLREKLAAKYFCNFSLFQSVPDMWAIDQVFPILPIHRLDEPPTLRISLCDLTCDSDGRIDRYVDRDGLDTTLPAHALKSGEPYLLGFFMVGAYQEILGDMHNLFGDTDAVDIALDRGGWKLLHAEHGDRTDELLRYVHFAPEDLLAAYERKLEASGLDSPEQVSIRDELKSGLSGYTYLQA